MPVLFPKTGNNWPLPPDYDSLTMEGQRLARVNAVNLRGRPELEAASWEFFRDYYLRPEDCGWYPLGTFTDSPQAHGGWITDWYSHPRLIHVAPRGSCKSTILLEDILRNLVSQRHWECTLFLSIKDFCTERIGKLARQLEDNSRILDDFGKMKPARGRGTWNRGSVLETTIGSKINARPFLGQSLGTRPSGLLAVDDVEKSKERTANPADLRQGFHDFFFNGLLPMARMPGRITPLRILGTLYDRKMFIYWLATVTDDPRITQFFHRTVQTVYDLNWDAMGPAWIEQEKERLGPAAFSAQCLNAPIGEGVKVLAMHPELTTYHVEHKDRQLETDPLHSSACLVTHQVLRIDTVPSENPDEPPKVVPVPRRLERTYGDAVRAMQRFILVDYADTTGRMSDYSVSHVLGLESDEAHPNTLYSLDAYMGKVPRSALVQTIVDQAMKWRPNVIGIEAYPLQLEAYERFQQEIYPQLLAKFGQEAILPAIIPIKFPTALSKAEKIKGLAWRFEQFRVKIPSDRGEEAAYRALWYQIENFTSDLGLLEHDDVLDTLAMHQGIVKNTIPQAVSVVKDPEPEEELLAGKMYDDMGFSNFEAVAASGNLTDRVANALYEAQLDELAEEENWDYEDYDQIGYT